MSAVGFGVGALALAVVMWVYFDAAERGKSAWLWALGTAFTSGLAALLYLLVRTTGRRREVARGAASREYLYVAWFCGAFLVSLGLSVGVGTLLYGAFADEGVTSDVRDVFASGIVAAVVGVVVMFVHWWLAERRLDDLSDAEFGAQYAMRRVALQTLVFVNALTATLSALVLFGGALSEMLGASYAYAAAWVPSLAPFLATGAMTAGAWMQWASTDRGAQAERFAAIPEPAMIQRPGPPPAVYAPMPMVTPPSVPTPPVPTPPVSAPAVPNSRYCGHCGTAVAEADDVFCRECGTRLALSPSASMSRS